MDRRELSRINVKFGKFLDPFLILLVIMILTTSVLSIQNLKPRTFSKEQFAHVLGVQEENNVNLELISGDHRYITNESLKEINDTHYKYTAFVQKPPEGRISKPILKFKGINDEMELRTHLVYTNSNNSKISIFSESQNINYVLQEKKQNYTPNIQINSAKDTFYLVIENPTPIYFNQYIEVSFFLNP